MVANACELKVRRKLKPMSHNIGIFLFRNRITSPSGKHIRPVGYITAGDFRGDLLSCYALS